MDRIALLIQDNLQDATMACMSAERWSAASMSSRKSGFCFPIDSRGCSWKQGADARNECVCKKQTKKGVSSRIANTPTSEVTRTWRGFLADGGVHGCSWSHPTKSWRGERPQWIVEAGKEARVKSFALHLNSALRSGVRTAIISPPDVIARSAETQTTSATRRPNMVDHRFARQSVFSAFNA